MGFSFFGLRFFGFGAQVAAFLAEGITMPPIDRAAQRNASHALRAAVHSFGACVAVRLVEFQSFGVFGFRV